MSFLREDFPHSSNYDSDLREVLRIVRDLNKKYTKLVEELEAMGVDVTNLKAEIARLSVIIDDFDKRIEEALEEMQHHLDDEIAQIRAELFAEMQDFMSRILNIVSDFSTLIDNKITTYNNELQRQLATQFNAILAEINALWRAIEEFNPTTMLNPLSQKYSSIPDTITYLYEHLRIHALPEWEFVSLGLTVTQYDSFNITAYDYALMGRDFLHRFFMFESLHPYTGIKTTEYNVNSFILNELLQSKNITQWDSGELTVEEYTALDKTVIEYLEINNTWDNLTVAQYPDLKYGNNKIIRMEV